MKRFYYFKYHYPWQMHIINLFIALIIAIIYLVFFAQVSALSSKIGIFFVIFIVIYLLILAISYIPMRTKMWRKKNNINK